MRRCVVAALAGLLVTASAACSGSSAANRSPSRSSTSASTAAAATGDRAAIEITDRTVRTPDGRTRTYRVVTPRSVPRDRAVPLLVALHGGVGSGAQFERTSGFDDLAARDHFVVVYPDGIEIGGASALARGQVWNGGRCCGAAAREQVDDVGFIRTVIGRVEKSRAIDRSRVYGTGHSNGAIMAYRLACELSDRIVAVGLQAGTIEIPSCAPTHPVSVLAIHGTADTNIPIDGGRGSGVAGIAFSSPVAAVDAFARIDRCGPPASATSPENPDVSNEAWTGCADGTGVEMVRVAGATHAWMGHPSPRASTALTGAPYQGFDSSAAIWDFLSRHSRAT